MPVIAAAVADLDGRLREWRHHLHQHPETAFQEHRTAGYLAGLLAGFGLDVSTGIGGTGIVASLRRGGGTGVLGLRADMDALALDERGRPAYASQHPGVMHACGHDGHMAMLLGAAAVLASEGGFDGTVRFIFQPAEEHGLGARAMLADGLFERFPVDAVYGLHNMPGIPAGHLHTRSGPIMASEDIFEIRITGQGGHASAPHRVIDPLVTGAEIVMALQTIVARNVDPQRSAVVSCTEFVTDGVRNAIPSHVTIRGDTRSFDRDIQALLEDRIRTLSANISAAHGATTAITYQHEFQPTVNDPACAAAAAQAAFATADAHQVDPDCPPVLASEDFALLAQAVPGCFTFIGNGLSAGDGGSPLHSGTYDFNDDILRVGVSFYRNLVRAGLPASS